MTEQFELTADDFDFRAFQRAFGMLHDKTLTGFMVQADCVTMTFDGLQFFSENYADPAVFTQYKAYHTCRVEIRLAPDALPGEQTVCLKRNLRHGRFNGKCLLLSAYTPGAAKKTFSEVSLTNTLTLNFFLRGSRYDEMSLCLSAADVRFDWT